MKKENDCFETKSLARQTYRVNINKICVNKYKKKKKLRKKEKNMYIHTISFYNLRIWAIRILKSNILLRYINWINSFKFIYLSQFLLTHSFFNS